MEGKEAALSEPLTKKQTIKILTYEEMRETVK